LGFVDEFVEWANRSLGDSEEAQEYLLGRGVSRDQWARHRLGFSAGDFSVDPGRDPGHDPSVCGDRDKKHLWCDSCRYARWSSVWEEVEGSPLRRQVVGRRISGSIVFPLTNYASQTVGFQVRSLDVKSYDTFAVSRRPEGYFFGIGPSMDAIWSSGEVWLVEGPADQLILERLVAPNVLALTTSALGKLQVLFLRRFVETVNLCLDMDAAGRKGVRQFFKFNAGDFDLRDVKYPRVKPKDKDLGDFWKRVGDEAFKKYFREKVLRV
jgi:DNA primase